MKANLDITTLPELKENEVYVYTYKNSTGTTDFILSGGEKVKGYFVTSKRNLQFILDPSILFLGIGTFVRSDLNFQKALIFDKNTVAASSVLEEKASDLVGLIKLFIDR